MKKILTTVLGILLLTVSFVSCSGNKDNTAIQVITREESSGTRSAFVELFGVTDADGKDKITANAETTQSTAVMLTSVADSKNAIGYVSLGSLSDDVRALSIDGVSATLDNIKNGSYKIQRPFNIAYKEASLSDTAKDFISFIMSTEGQKIISDHGYIPAKESTEAYTDKGASGKIVLAGSTSVGPIMEKLAEAYRKRNPDVTIDVQQTGSGAGITSAIENTCDIAMSSRALKASESAELTSLTIAQDGIAVIVSKQNSVEGLTSEQVKNIFLGSIADWSELSK